MTYTRGSAVRLILEVDEYTGTTAYVTLTDPDGTELLSESAMTYTTSPSARFIKIWQSSAASILGKYLALMKTVNGIYENKAKHVFFLEAET